MAAWLGHQETEQLDCSVAFLGAGKKGARFLIGGWRCEIGLLAGQAPDGSFKSAIYSKQVRLVAHL